jgi:predicted DCC family thiol-disulfide oxidoreductase YuxK
MNPAFSTPPAEGDALLYDGECPFCSNYIALLAVRKLSPKFEVIDARSRPGLWQEMLRQGYDIDQGMMLRWKGALYHGADAMHALSLIAGDHPFGLVNRWIFRSRARSRLFYPFLRWGRNTTLRLLGRSRIRSAPVA